MQSFFRPSQEQFQRRLFLWLFCSLFPLDFKLNDSIKQEVRKVRGDFDAATGKLDLSILEYYGFGKEAIKKFNFYPDGIMQLAFQVRFLPVSSHPRVI